MRNNPSHYPRLSTAQPRSLPPRTSSHCSPGPVHIVVILQSRGFITISYNLGTEDINIAEESKPLNDGGYHVIRLVCL